LLGLRDALSVLDKSSPYAVSTESDLTNSELNEVKNHLYIETEIEKAFADKISQLENDEILFLCGSSGDGKSELLTRYYEKYRERIDFHLDATHSFEPQSTAIDTLNNLFLAQKESNRPLVVGINIGMLGNFAEEGASNHDDIKEAIKIFLNKKITDQTCHYFMDFEAFPKFDLISDSHTSKFIQQLLSKLTEQSDNNPFYVLYKRESVIKENILCANYQLLSMVQVQNMIIDLLLKSRLVKDQFITARALLDFVHYLLTGPRYLFDNLFHENDNELGSKVFMFDPCSFRKKNLDLFILQWNLELLPADFYKYSKDLEEIGIKCKDEIVDQYSFVRLFYVMKNQEFSNNYHFNYKSDFEDCLIDEYAKIWCLHSRFDGDKDEKSELKEFYKSTVLAAINKYANRNSSNLSKDEFFVSSHNGWDLTVELELSVNYKKISDSHNQKIGSFLAYIKVEDKTLSPIPISINLLNLMYRIVHGYRPNKHDKNTVVLLDDIVDQIKEVANTSNTLYLHTGSSKIKIKEIDFDDIEVSGVSE